MADDIDAFDVGPQESGPMDELVRAALATGSDDKGDSTRIILKPTPRQRADLDSVREMTQARTQTQVMMDALEQYKATLRMGSLSLGSIGMLYAKISALEDGCSEDRANFQRFAAVLSGYQRCFTMFTILHEAGQNRRHDVAV